METIVKGVVSRAIPQACPDNVHAGEPIRLSRFQEIYVQNIVPPTKHPICDEGSYFVSTSTAGTALAYGIITAFSDTTTDVIWVIQNNGSISDPFVKRLYIDYLRLTVTVAPATATQAFYAIKVDNVSRVPSANLSLITPVNTNMDSSMISQAKSWLASGGAMTVPASSSQARTIVAQGSLRAAIPVVGDELVTIFGSTDIGGSVGTTGGRVVTHAPPVVLGPQQYMVFYLWFPGNATTAMSYHADAGWWER